MEHRTSTDGEDFAAEVPLYGDEYDFPSEEPARPQFAERTTFRTTDVDVRPNTLTNPSATNTLFREDVVPLPREEQRWRLADRPTYGLMAAGVALAGLVGFVFASYSQRASPSQSPANQAPARPVAGSTPVAGSAVEPVAQPTPPAAAAEAKWATPRQEIPAPVTQPHRPAAPSRSPQSFNQGLSGWWSVTNRIESTGPEVQDLNLGYRLLLTQNGNRITGTGRKWMENGRPLPASEQTAITVDGVVEGPKVVLHLATRDTPGTTTGTFTYNLTDTGLLQGNFSSDVAQLSGSSQARRMPSQQ